MSKFSRAALAGAMISLALPATGHADPCGFLAGGRWAFYMEGTFTPVPGRSMSIWTYDFRSGRLYGLGLGAADKVPAAPPATSSAGGSEELAAVQLCAPAPKGHGAIRLTINSGAVLDVTPATDNVSGTVQGIDPNDAGMTGSVIRFH